MAESRKDKSNVGTSRTRNYSHQSKSISQDKAISRSKSAKNIEQCSSHIFELVPLKKESYYKQGVKYTYFHDELNDKPFPSILNEFLGQTYISLFGIPSQNVNYKKNNQKYKDAYQKQILNMELKINEGVENKKSTRSIIPQPIPKNKYCQICRKDYEDYQKHCNDKMHMKISRESTGAKMIKSELQQMEEMKKSYFKDLRLIQLQKLNQNLKTSVNIAKKRMRSFTIQLVQLHQSCYSN